MPATTDTPPPKPTRTKSSIGGFRRVQIGFNVIIQIAVVTVIILLVNAFAFRHFKRFDLSRDRKYALSPRTKQFLGSLDKPVKFIVFMDARSPLQSDVANLAVEYREAQPKMIQLEQVDPFRNVARATDIQSKYKLAAQENVVILDCEGRQAVITDDKMADVDPGNPMLGTQAQITAFKGEQAITSGLVEVTEGKKNAVYYLQGHGEPPMTGNASPLAMLGKMIEAEHINLQTLNLLNVNAIPADASVVMLLGPSYDLSDRESQLLTDYWTKGGRILLLLNPEVPTPHIAALLDKVGIQADDDRLFAYASLMGVTRLVTDAVGEFIGDSPITKTLQGVDTLMLGDTQTLTLHPDRVLGSNIKLMPLIQAKKGFWGETDYKDVTEDNLPKPDEAKDKKDNLIIAASVEQGAVGDQRVKVPSARMIVNGNARFIRADALADANANFFIGSLNWLLAREQLIGIAPKEVKKYTLNLPPEQEQTIFWVSVLAVPGFFAFLGVAVWWRRRS